jgi:hypothetical protein
LPSLASGRGGLALSPARCSIREQVQSFFGSLARQRLPCRVRSSLTLGFIHRISQCTRTGSYNTPVREGSVRHQTLDISLQLVFEAQPVISSLQSLRLGEKRLQLMGGVKDAGIRIMSLVGGAGSTVSRWKGNHLFPDPIDMLMERGCQLS